MNLWGRRSIRIQPVPNWLILLIGPALALAWASCHPADEGTLEVLVYLFLILGQACLFYSVHRLSDSSWIHKVDLDSRRQLLLAISVHPYKRLELLPTILKPVVVSGPKPISQFELLHELAHFRYCHAIGYILVLSSGIYLLVATLVQSLARGAVCVVAFYALLAEISRQQEMQADTFAAKTCDEGIVGGLHDILCRGDVPMAPWRLVKFLWLRTLPNFGWRRVLYFFVWYSNFLYGYLIPFLLPAGFLAIVYYVDPAGGFAWIWLAALLSTVYLAWLAREVSERLLRAIGIKTFYMKVTQMPFVFDTIPIRPQKRLPFQERQRLISSQREYGQSSIGLSLLSSWRLIALTVALLVIAIGPAELFRGSTAGREIAERDKLLEVVSEVDGMPWVDDDNLALVVQTLWKNQEATRVADSSPWRGHLSVERERSTTTRYIIYPSGRTESLAIPTRCASFFELSLRPQRKILRKSTCFGNLQFDWQSFSRSIFPRGAGFTLSLFAVPILSILLLTKPWQRPSGLWPKRVDLRLGEGIRSLNLLFVIALLLLSTLDLDSIDGRPSKEDWSLHLRLGQAHFERGSYEMAISSYEHALELNPTFARGVALLADAYDGAGNPGRARALMRQAIVLDPNLSYAYSRLAQLKLKVENDPRSRLENEALKAIETAAFLQGNPERISSWKRVVPTFSTWFLKRLITAIKNENVRYSRGERDIRVLLDERRKESE